MERAAVGDASRGSSTPDRILLSPGIERRSRAASSPPRSRRGSTRGLGRHSRPQRGADVGEFVDWCHEGLAAAGVVGEILIVDSWTDRTAEIALAARRARAASAQARARTRVHRRAPVHPGPYVRHGRRRLHLRLPRARPFVEAFREGYEYVMGSRLQGSIEPGAMPALHRYFGTPVTTWILNRLYSQPASRTSTAGCAASRADALERMRPASRSRGSTRRRWCSSRCTWSCAPPRSR